MERKEDDHDGDEHHTTQRSGGRVTQGRDASGVSEWRCERERDHRPQPTLEQDSAAAEGDHCLHTGNMRPHEVWRHIFERGAVPHKEVEGRWQQ